MALDVAVGSFNIGTGAAGTTVTITPGFQVKALILWWSGRTESIDAAGGATHLQGLGFATSASAFKAVASRELDGAGTGNQDSAGRSDCCILQMNDGATVGRADVQSISSTQVVFEILAQFSIDLRISYLALGGSDITNAECGQFSHSGTAPVNQTVNTTGTGKLIFFAGTRVSPPAPEALGTQSWIHLGVATSASAEYTLLAGSIGGTSPDSASYCRAGECISMGGSTLGVQNRAEFVSFNTSPNGFTINWLERGGSFFSHYLMLDGTFQVALGDLATLATTGTITESGLSFQPTALLLASGCKAESAADTVDFVNDAEGHQFSLGAATSTSNRHVQYTGSRSNNTTSFVQSAIQYDEIYANMSATTDAVIGSADFTGFTSDGFTLDQDDADPSAAFVWYLALAGGGASYSITGSGGMAFAGAVTPIRGAVRAASGGVSFGGSVAPVRGSQQPAPSGGVAFGGTASQAGTQTFTLVAAGGLTFGGSVTPLRGSVQVGAGALAFGGTSPPVRGSMQPQPTEGISFAGSVVPLRGAAIIGAGGLAFTGTAPPVRGSLQPTPSGGVVFSGVASQSGQEAGLQSYSITGAGSLAFSGAVTPIRGSLIAGAGAVSFAGAVTPVRGAVVMGAGGVAFGGAVTPLRGFALLPDGGLVLSGVAAQSGQAAGPQSYAITGAGGVTFAGAMALLRGRASQPVSGGLVFGGAATITYAGAVTISIVQARGTYRPILSAQATVAWHPGPFDPAIFDEDIFDTFRMAPIRATASYVPVVTAKGRTS